VVTNVGNPALNFALRYNRDMNYVYVLVNESEDVYIGSTGDLRRRISEHNSGRNTSTKNHRWTLVYYEAYLSKQDMHARENQLKKHGQAKRWLKQRIKNSLKQS